MQRSNARVFMLFTAVGFVGAGGGRALGEGPSETVKAASEKDGKVYVRMTTTLGDMVIELNREKAPITVENFLGYADSGFYEGTMFHRIISDFMAQGGGMTEDYTRKETRDPIQNEADNGLKNRYGAIAMARTGDPHSATSQFFINVKDNDFLNHSAKSQAGWGYCVFGRVIDGLDTLEAIRTTPVHQDPRADRQKPAAADTPVVIKKVERADASKLTEAIAKAAAADAEQARKDADEAQKKADALKAAMDAGRALVASKDVDISKGVTTPSGLWYVDAVEGSGDTPPQAAKVTVQYTGWLTDGTKFDSSYDHGEPAKFKLNMVIAGWTEGVGTMKPGGKRYLVIPPDLGYGPRGYGKSIPGDSVLVFEVEFIGLAE